VRYARFTPSGAKRAFLFQKWRAIKMAEETQPTTETVATEAQGATGTVNQTIQKPAVDEPFDQARAMETIQKQRAEEKRLKAELKDYERLKADEQKRLDAQLSETDRLKKQADELANQNAKLLLDILRRDVVAETGIPPVFAERLKGATKEEMLADAQEILKVLPQPTKQAPHLKITNPGNAGTGMTDDERRDFLGLRR
jgi:hypothetical protein